MSDETIRPEIESLKVEVINIKEDIKEIKADSKETNVYFREVINSLTENSIRQTEILKNQEKRFTKTDQDIASLNDDITGLRVDLKENLEGQTKWYQDFLNDNFGKFIKILFVIILLLLGVKILGVDITKFIGQ